MENKEIGRGRRDKIFLASEQRQRLEKISRNGHDSTKKILHAQILLMSDEGERAKGKWTDNEIAKALNVHRNTVTRVRKRFLEMGETTALERKVRNNPPIKAKVDGELEAQIIALCCSEPPDGRKHWSIRLLTSELKRRTIVMEMSRETVRRTLKKTNYVLGKENGFVYPNET